KYYLRSQPNSLLQFATTTSAITTAPRMCCIWISLNTSSAKISASATHFRTRSAFSRRSSVCMSRIMQSMFIAIILIIRNHRAICWAGACAGHIAAALARMFAAGLAVEPRFEFPFVG
ncbi:MAG TPA: hypothetical protein PLI96_11445, partial [Halothiobacillus sp.]|nr:hypothetical protein [Halothiobacillus sp.]